MKKTQTIAVVNYKGGTGKTTTALNFGAELAEKGYKVLLIDFDGQGNLTKAATGEKNVDRIKETITTSLNQIMKGNKVTLPITKTYKENLDIIPCNVTMADTKVGLILAMARETILKRTLEDVKNKGDYDYILIDNAPSVEIDFINSLVAADEVLIVSSPDTFSCEGIQNLLVKYLSVKKYFNHDLEISGILINNVDMRNNFTKDMIKVIKKYFEDLKIFKTHIPRSIRVNESQAESRAVGDYEKKNKVAKAFTDFTNEYLESKEYEIESEKIVG